MIKGKLTHAGNVQVDGEIPFGIFISVSQEEFRNPVHHIGEEVEVRSASAGTAQQKIAADSIVGDLISREKYSFVDGKLIASIVRDVVDILRRALSS